MKKAYILLCIMLYGSIVTAQVKIGGTDGVPNASAMLEVQSTNKGILLPRVALSATNLASPLAAHVAGMTVYNTATASTGNTAVTPGQYYNDGLNWHRIANSTEVTSSVTANNGLTKTNANIALGGELTSATSIGTTSTNTLAVAGLQQTATLVTDKVVVMDANGVLKIANASDFAKTINNTVYSAGKDGGWGLVSLGISGQTLSKINLSGTDTKIGNAALFSNGVYTAPSKGIYVIKYEFELAGGVDLSLLGNKKLVLLKNNSQIIDEKLFDAVRVVVAALINLASVPVTSTELNSMATLNAGETVTFAVDTGGVNLSLLTGANVSLHIYKISD